MLYFLCLCWGANNFCVFSQMWFPLCPVHTISSSHHNTFHSTDIFSLARGSWQFEIYPPASWQPVIIIKCTQRNWWYNLRSNFGHRLLNFGRGDVSVSMPTIAMWSTLTSNDNRSGDPLDIDGSISYCWQRWHWLKSHPRYTGVTGTGRAGVIICILVLGVPLPGHQSGHEPGQWAYKKRQQDCHSTHGITIALLTCILYEALSPPALTFYESKLNKDVSSWMGDLDTRN
jgi:hypothetical protein